MIKSKSLEKKALSAISVFNLPATATTVYFRSRVSVAIISRMPLFTANYGSDSSVLMNFIAYCAKSRPGKHGIKEDVPFSDPNYGAASTEGIMTILKRGTFKSLVTRCNGFGINPGRYAILHSRTAP